MDKFVIISDSIISAVAFAMGYSVSRVQYKNTLSPALFFTKFFLWVSKILIRANVYHEKCLLLKSRYFYAKRTKPMKPLLVFRKQGILFMWFIEDMLRMTLIFFRKAYLLNTSQTLFSEQLIYRCLNRRCLLLKMGLLLLFCMSCSCFSNCIRITFY